MHDGSQPHEVRQPRPPEPHELDTQPEEALTEKIWEPSEGLHGAVKRLPVVLKGFFGSGPWRRYCPGWAAPFISRRGGRSPHGAAGSTSTSTGPGEKTAVTETA